MKIFIVGGAGYLGGAIVDHLEETNEHEFVVYDSLVYEDSYRRPVRFVYGDTGDTTKLAGWLLWADVVVWLAAVVGDGACQLNPDVSRAVNQEAVKWLSENFDGRIIFTSTCSVYGAQDGVLTEESPTNPISVYAATKLGAEKYLTGKDALIFRLGTLYGVGDLFARIRFDLIVNVLTMHAHADNKITVYGGEQFRPILHVRDAAKAIIEQCVTEHTGIYNVKDQNVRIIDLAHQVRNYFPDLEMNVTDMEFEDARNYRVDDSKARAIGFNTEHTVDFGIRQIKEMLDEGRIKDFTDPRYSNERFLSKGEIWKNQG